MAPHTEVTFSDTHASPSRGPWSSRPVLGAAAVAASRRALVGRRHEARRSRLFCGPQALRARGLVAFRLRPASRPLPVWVGLAALGRRASSVVCARFTPAPPLSARPRRQKGGRGLAWLVVRGLSRRARAAGSCVALSSCAPRFWAAWRVVGLGVSFLKRSLRARPAPAACFVSPVAAVTGLAFLRSRTRVLALPRPAPLVRAGRDKARSNQVGGGNERTESVKGKVARPWRGQSAWLWWDQRERS